MNLMEATVGTVYTVNSIGIEDEELKSFLFTLGCYGGEPLTVIKKRQSGCIVSIKNARYSIDANLARAITVN